MSAGVVGLIGVVILLILIFMRVWVGAAMAIVGFLGLVYLDDWNRAFSVLGTEPYSQMASYTLTAVPLFIFMGLLVSHTELGKDLYKAASKWIGQIRGGLAMASAGVCGIFSAICGDSMACAVTIGKVAYPEMKRYNYNSKLATGCIAAGGTIGILIPPSLGFILYGLLTEQSIGKLFMAGLIPGILQVIFYIITAYIITRIFPDWGPAIADVKPKFREKVKASAGVLPVLIILLLVLGGIYAGVFTPTEAGAIGAFGTLIVSFINRKLTWNNFKASLRDTTQTTAMIALMITGAYIFMRFLAVSGAPAMLSEFVAGLDVPKGVILLGIIILYVILGCFLDIFASIILTLPIIFPVVLSCGFDPIWFGVIMVRLMEIGLITPPFGLNIFVLSSAVNVPAGTIFRGVIPFLISDVFHLALLIAVPEVSLFLTR